MEKKSKIVSIIMSVIMSAVMGILAAFLVRYSANEQQLSAMPPAPIMYILNTVESITVGVLLVLIVPLGKWGRGLAAKANANPPSFKFTLLNCLPVSVISAIVVSAIVCFINVVQAHSKIPAEAAPPLMGMFFGSWIKLLIPSIFISYILSIIISPIVVQAVGLGGPGAGSEEGK